MIWVVLISIIMIFMEIFVGTKSKPKLNNEPCEHCNLVHLLNTRINTQFNSGKAYYRFLNTKWQDKWRWSQCNYAIWWPAGEEFNRSTKQSKNKSFKTTKITECNFILTFYHNANKSIKYQQKNKNDCIPEMREFTVKSFPYYTSFWCHSPLFRNCFRLYFSQ